MGYDSSRVSGPKSKSLRGTNSASTAATEANGEEADEAATSLSPSSPLRSNINLKTFYHTYFHASIIINTYYFLF